MVRDLTAPKAPKNVATRAVLLAAALIVGGLLFQQLVTLLLAVLITVIIAIPLGGCATRLERFHIPRWLGVLLTLLTALLIVAGIIALIIPSFVEQARRRLRRDHPQHLRRPAKPLSREATGAKQSKAGADIQDYLQGYLDEPSKLIAAPRSRMRESPACSAQRRWSW